MSSLSTGTSSDPTARRGRLRSRATMRSDCCRSGSDDSHRCGPLGRYGGDDDGSRRFTRSALPLAVIRDRRPAATIEIGRVLRRPRARFGRRRRIWRSIFRSEALSSRDPAESRHRSSLPSPQTPFNVSGTNTVAIGGPRTRPRSRGPTDDRRGDRGHRRGQLGDPRRSRERTRAAAHRTAPSLGRSPALPLG